MRWKVIEVKEEDQEPYYIIKYKWLFFWCSVCKKTNGDFDQPITIRKFYSKEEVEKYVHKVKAKYTVVDEFTT
jgi:hypothetical protein